MPKTALITGASKGIGKALTKVFAREGYDLVLIARSEDKLKQLAQECQEKYQNNIHVIVADLSKPEACANIIKDLTENKISVDTLVNNAGYGSLAAFADTDIDVLLGVLKVNMLAVTELTRLLIPHMIEQKFGEIMNIASTAAFLPGPFGAVYYATKAYVLSLSESLWYELKDKNIKVTAICPGPVKTEFFDRAGADKNKIPSRMVSFMDADVCAEKAFIAMKKNKRVAITDIMLKPMAFTASLIPRALTNYILTSVHKNAEKK
ncbi:MAG: SDR family oxidoreductase [Pseudomonadota bacterium]